MIDFVTRLAILHFLFFYFFNYIIAFPISILLALIKNESKSDKVGYFTSRIILVIIFSTLSSTVVLLNSDNMNQQFIFGLIGGILLLFNLMYNLYLMKQRRLERLLKNGFSKHHLGKEYNYDNIFLIVGIVIFILTLFIPYIADNPINNLFFKLTSYLMNIQILNWIIITLSYLFLIQLIWKMFKTVFGVWFYRTTIDTD